MWGSIPETVIALEDYPLAKQYSWGSFGAAFFKNKNLRKPRKPRRFLNFYEEKAIGIEYLNLAATGSNVPLITELALKYDISISYMYRIARRIRSGFYSVSKEA